MTAFSTVLAAAFTLVDGGVPKAELVVAADAPPPEVFAAEDLRHWVKEITGAELGYCTVKYCTVAASATGVVTADRPASAGRRGADGTVPVSADGTVLSRVFIGQAFAREKYREDFAAFGEKDGFAIRRDGNDLYLFGGRPRSAIYATSRLLELNTDVIWARPAEEFGTVFTKTNTLELAMTDRRELPAFWEHGWTVGGVRRDFATGKWALRNGANNAGQTEPKGLEGTLGMLNVLGGHNFWWVARPKEDFQAHPEWFGYSSATKKREQGTLCLTAPGIVERAIERYGARIAEQQDLEGFLVGMRDSYECCECERCAAPIRCADGTVLTARNDKGAVNELHQSTRYWTFVRDVCTGLRKRFPKLRFFGWGYFYAQHPPKCELPEWLYCEFCPYNGYNRELIAEWNRRLPGHVTTLEYWLCEATGVPQVRGPGAVATWQERMRWQRREIASPGLSAFIGPDSERRYGVGPIRAEWDANPVSRWLATRVMWNPDQDLGALKNFYYVRAYREAAKTMSEYHELQGRATHDPSIRPKARTLHNSNERDRLEGLLVKALAEVKHPTAKTLIRRQYDHWMLARKTGGAETVSHVAKDEPHREVGNWSWSQAYQLPDFKLPPYYTWGRKDAPKAKTVVKAQEDGEALFVLVEAEAAKPEGDYVYVRITPGKGVKGVKPFERKITPGGSGVVKTERGYAAVLELKFADWQIDRTVRGTFPQYEFVRLDAVSGERSTPGGAYINIPAGTFNF